MTYITAEHLEQISISTQEIVELVGNVLKHKSKSLLPAKTSIKFKEHNFFNIMPCIMPELNLSGVKCISRYEGRTPSLDGEIFLYDYQSGLMKGVIDAKKITILRTAAVAIHSLKLLAKSDYKIVSIIGLGEIGKATLKMLIDLNDRELEIRLFNYKDHATNLAEKYKDVKNVNIKIFDNHEQMLKDSDVVISAITYAEKDFVDSSIYKPGVLIIPIHTLGFQSCDLTFDKVFGDDYNHIKHFKYFNQFKQFNEVADVVNGKCAGRENDSERILAYNIGIALHDVAFANYILNKMNCDIKN